jgi:hypothetical protein
MAYIVYESQTFHVAIIREQKPQTVSLLDDVKSLKIFLFFLQMAAECCFMLSVSFWVKR